MSFAGRIFSCLSRSGKRISSSGVREKSKDEIQQRVHEQKAALFQGVDCGQLAGLSFTNHALRPAIGESLHKLAG